MAVPIGFEPMASAFGGRKFSNLFSGLDSPCLSSYLLLSSQFGVTARTILWAPFERTKAHLVKFN